MTVLYNDKNILKSTCPIKTLTQYNLSVNNVFKEMASILGKGHIFSGFVRNTHKEAETQAGIMIIIV